MKKIIGCILLLLFLNNAYAQQQSIDGLKSAVMNAKDDTTKILAMRKLGRFYLYSKPDTAMLLTQQGIALSKKVGFYKGQADLLNLRSSIFFAIGNYPQALESLVNAYKLDEQNNDKLGIAKDLLEMGNIASIENDFKQAIIYYTKSKAAAETLNDRQDLEFAIGNMGDAYEKMNKLDSAQFYTQKAYELALNLKNRDMVATATNNLGNIYSKMNNRNIALGYYRTAIPIWIKENDDDGLAESAIGMAKLFKQLGQKDSRLYYARLSMAAGRHGGFQIRVLAASKFLNDYFFNEAQIDSAYHYQNIAVQANEALFSQEKTKEVQSQAFEEKQREQEMAEQKLMAEEQSKKNLQLAGIAVFIPSFFLFVLLLSRRRAKSRTVEFLIILALLMFFEFITLLLHPYIEKLTHETPVFSLMILVGIAALIVPLHHRAEHWVKSKLVSGHQRRADDAITAK